MKLPIILTVTSLLSLICGVSQASPATSPHHLEPNAPRSVTVSKPESEGQAFISLMFYCAGPIGNLNINRFDPQTMPLCVLHQHGGGIKAHWLIVKNGAGEGGEIFHFEICGGVRNQGEARRMRFRKAIECKRTDVLNDVS